jgi:hypothetical protein
MLFMAAPMAATVDVRVAVRVVSLVSERDRSQAFADWIVMEIVECPDIECSMPAEILDRWNLASTGGPFEHVKTRCIAGHIFTLPAQRLALWPPMVRPGQDRPSGSTAA